MATSNNSCVRLSRRMLIPHNYISGILGEKGQSKCGNISQIIESEYFAVSPAGGMRCRSIADPTLPTRSQLLTPQLIVRESCGAYLPRNGK